MAEIIQPDVALGAFVYCKSHVAPHETGWCSVDVRNKIALKATTHQEAVAEVDAMGLPRHNHCDICKRFVANEDWYRHAFGPRRRTCPEHDE